MKKHPTIITIGGSFAGWTSLQGLLTEHPQVVDEFVTMRYFNSKLWQTKDAAWYLAGLPSTTSHATVTGEVSLDYVYNPQVPSRIVRTFPDTKLLAIVRNPLIRAIAEFQYYKKLPQHRPYASCHEFMLANPAVVDRGKFGKHLESYFNYYSPLELQVVVYDELISHPLAVAERLYRWLDIDPTFVPKRLFSFVPPEEPPLHPSWLTRLKMAIKKKRTEKKRAKLAPWQPPQPRVRDWFTAEEEAYWVKEYWADAIQLSAYVYEDMTVHWFPDYQK